MINRVSPSLQVNGHVPTMEEEPVSKQDDLITTSSTSELPSIKGSLVRRISSRHSGKDETAGLFCSMDFIQLLRHVTSPISRPSTHS